MVKRKTYCFREADEAGDWREKVMAKDEEEKAEAGEVEKEEGEKNQCEQCGKSYVSMEGIYYC